MSYLVQAHHCYVFTIQIDLGDRGVLVAKLPAQLEVHAQQVAKQDLDYTAMHCP